MKKIFSFITIGLALMALLSACQEKQTIPQPSGKGVDLRCRVENEYNLDAISPKPFNITVKSSKPWTITSAHPDWCIIEQEEGEAQPDSLVHIGQGENTTLKVQYYNNPSLDDRTDYIEIASDGWVAKKVTINQKGIAYLNVPEADIEEGLMIEKAGGDLAIHVKSNQKWTAKIVPEDGADKADWVSITDGASGELDGIVTMNVKENSGEKRYAYVAVYDRHDEERVKIHITQDGVQLDPETFEIRVGYNELSASLNVVCNTKWTAEKGGTEDWYSIDNPDGHDGDGVLKITLTDNSDATAVRKGSILLKTIAANPGDPVAQKEITIKQAYPLSPVRVYVDKAEISEWKSDKGEDPVYLDGVGTSFAKGPLGYARLNRSMPAGSYSFHWKNFGAEVRVRHWFCYSDGQEIKFDLKADGTTSISFNNGSSAKPSDSGSLSGIDMNTDHIMSYVFSQEGKYCHVSLQVDGQEAFGFSSSASVMNMVTWGTSINMYIGVETGSAVLDWYEYTPPFSWDEE